MRLAPAVTLLAGLLLSCNQVPQSGAGTAEAGTHDGWTVIEAGTTNLNAVSGVSDEALWVVGDSGTIGRWDGKKLSWEKSGTKANLRGVWALGAESAYAVGDDGTILQRSASGWQQVGAGLTRQVLNAVWADTTRVYAVGSTGTVILGGSMGYQIVPPVYGSVNLTENLFGVTGTAGGPVTAVGTLGLVLQITGTTLSRTTIPNFTKLLNGVAAGQGNMYYVGQQGTVYRSDATGLNPVAGCPTMALRAVSTVAADAWAAGWDGTVCKISGTTVTSYPYTDSRWFNGIYAASAKSLWLVGASGTMLHGLPVTTKGDS